MRSIERVNLETAGLLLEDMFYIEQRKLLTRDFAIWTEENKGKEKLGRSAWINVPSREGENRKRNQKNGV